MANTTYNHGKFEIGTGVILWASGAQTFRCLLTTGGYVPDPDHNFVSDVTNELAGGGYARQDIAGRTVTEDDANDRADFKGNATSFTGLSSVQTFRWVVVYKFVTVDADSILIEALDMGAAGINLTGLTAITLRWDADPVNGRLFSIT